MQHIWGIKRPLWYAAYNILRGSLENITLSKNVRYPSSSAPSLKSGLGTCVYTDSIDWNWLLKDSMSFP